ncbi:MAG: thiamine phosphate synthase [Acidimicrobiales bacterium]
MGLRSAAAQLLANRRLYLCTGYRDDLVDFLRDCIEGGVDVVQLRDKNLDDDAILRYAPPAQKVCAAYGVPFLLNDRPDMAAELGADGVHVGQDDMPAPQARLIMGDAAIVGLSTHAPDQLARALREPVDYISAGPVVATPTKPGRPPTGIGYVTEAARQCSAHSPAMPFFVTGDARPDTVGPLAAAGARRFVAVRWLTQASDPRTAASRLAEAIDQAVQAILPADPAVPGTTLPG